MFRRAIVVMWMGVWAAGAVAAEDSKMIVVTGRAVGTTEVAAEEAKLDALRVAVRRVCGAFINAQSETDNYTLVRDKILEHPVGFARIVKIIKGPEVMAGITQVQLEAEVFPVQFERKWAEFAHIKQREGNPRCVLVVYEDDDVDRGNPPIPNGVVQTGLEDFFLSQKVRLMDKGTTDSVRMRDLQLAALTGDLEKAAAVGAAFNADVVLVGRAEAKSGGPVTIAGHELRRWNATLTVRVVQADSGAILVSKTYRPSKTYSTTTGSGKDALLALARECAPAVLSDVGSAWRERATAGKIINVTLDPCSRKRFRAVQAEMIKSKGVTGGEDGFKLRELVSSVASVEVNWKYDLNQLADRIEELSVQVDGEVLTFEIVEQTANRISVRVKVRPQVEE